MVWTASWYALVFIPWPSFFLKSLARFIPLTLSRCHLTTNTITQITRIHKNNGSNTLVSNREWFWENCGWPHSSRLGSHHHFIRFEFMFISNQYVSEHFLACVQFISLPAALLHVWCSVACLCGVSTSRNDYGARCVIVFVRIDGWMCVCVFCGRRYCCC